MPQSFCLHKRERDTLKTDLNDYNSVNNFSCAEPPIKSVAKVGLFSKTYN